MNQELINCSFCSSALPAVQHMIKGREVVKGIEAYICDECIVNCQGVLTEQRESKTKKKDNDKEKLTPEKIVKHLDQYVIGQSDAKKLLAVAVYNHYKRIGKKLDVEIQKSNILMIGPTGSGKTYLVRHLAKLLDVPFTQADSTTLTEAGYVGDDVDMILGNLVTAANGDIAKAQQGIIYIDEIDKLATTNGNSRDVKGEGVQQSLLKMLEGSVMQINPQGGKKNPQGPLADIDTTDILFICGGAFGGITDTQNKRKPLGFAVSKEIEEEKKDVLPKQIIKYGMIPEFVGRLPIIAKLELLKPKELYRILTEPKNSLVRQYQALFDLDNIELEFTDEFLLGIAERSFNDGIGARGLRSIMEKALSDHMFKSPGKKIKKIVVGLETLKPELEVVR